MPNDTGDLMEKVALADLAWRSSGFLSPIGLPCSALAALVADERAL